MLYRADTVLPMATPSIDRGAVRVEGDRIVAVGSASELRPEPGEGVTDRGAISARQSFTEWIKNINALRRAFSPADFIESIAEGFQMLEDGGVTTVANIESVPELLPLLPVPPLRTWWFLELIDVRQRLNGEEMLMGALSFFEQHPEWLGGFGLSPHAPYTASVDLYRLARTCGDTHGMLATTHIAESVEEHEMFSHARGPLFEFLAELGRDNSDCGQGSALSHLVEHGVIGSNWIIAHLNYLQDYDYELVANAGSSVVHCPKCHAHFGHAMFPLRELRDRGVNICLGTDSLASNNALDMRSEMREARQVHGLGDRETLEMATLNGARALMQTHKLGELSPGSLADLVAFPYPDKAVSESQPEAPYRRVLQSQAPPRLLVVNGVERISPTAAKPGTKERIAKLQP
jgi:cytosine/adenosine deaminase-related metal-dependent hydrolase